MTNRVLLLLIALLSVFSVWGQMHDPVHFTSELRMTGTDEGEIIFSGTIDDGWHVYSTDIKGSGPIQAAFNAVRMDGAEKVGRLQPRGNVIRKYDDMFGMEVSYMEHSAVFVQCIKFTKPKYDIDCYLEYGVCNDKMCLPPGEAKFVKKGEVTLKSDEKGESTEDAAIVNVVPADTVTTANTSVAATEADTLLSAAPATANYDGGKTEDSLLYTLLLGFIGGLLAVLMPCIWPVIPMTVSFFMRQAKGDRRKSVRDALLYGLSIIVIYMTLGMAVTMLFGSDALNAFSTSAVFNIAIFLLLVVFSLSLFGLFELRLPSSWATALDKKVTNATLFQSFLMALTLVVVSFSCTAPIVGLLLVQVATTGNWLSPLMGMFGFALALALPFTLFALFPSWMKQMPHSGEWMNHLKVVLAFIELAFSLKFLSVADLAYGWHLLSRELFFVLWIIIFVMLAIYLLFAKGKGMVRILSITGAVLSLSFAAYMVPGLWGAPCTLVSAFAPPMEAVKAHYNDYDKGMAVARRERKPVLIDFTGYGCVNCRKMEAAVWTDPRVASILKNDYILISLYVDDKTPLKEPMDVTVAGKKKTLRTVGAKWSYLESSKFGSNAQPFYVILSYDGRLLVQPRGYDEDIDEYLKFLHSGLNVAAPHSD